jgi:hypothetical protein
MVCKTFRKQLQMCWHQNFPDDCRVDNVDTETDVYWS